MKNDITILKLVETGDYDKWMVYGNSKISNFRIDVMVVHSNPKTYSFKSISESFSNDINYHKLYAKFIVNGIEKVMEVYQ